MSLFLFPTHLMFVNAQPYAQAGEYLLMDLIRRQGTRGGDEFCTGGLVPRITGCLVAIFHLFHFSEATQATTVLQYLIKPGSNIKRLAIKHLSSAMSIKR